MMELDELKSAWSQYDKKLAESLKLNEELLRKINLSTSKREMQKPLIYEIGNIAIGVVLFIFSAVWSLRLLDEPKFSIPGFIVALVSILIVVFSIIKTNKFLVIDYYGSSILKLQRDVAQLNKLILKYRKFELTLLPVLIVPLIPLVFKVISNIDIYHKLGLFVFEIIAILGISIPATIWINKRLYDDKFRNTERLLADLDKFEKEV